MFGRCAHPAGLRGALVSDGSFTYGGTAYQDPANEDPLSPNSENIALVN